MKTYQDIMDIRKAQADAQSDAQEIKRHYTEKGMPLWNSQPAFKHHEMQAIPIKDKQVGGDHYKKLPIQPMEYILANDLGFIEGSVVKYVSRWKLKGGVEDLEKARDNLTWLIERAKK